MMPPHQKKLVLFSRRTLQKCRPTERGFKVERAGFHTSARISELKGLQDDCSLPTENFIHVPNSIQKTFEIHTTLVREK
jgi:hypothetical protein